MASRTWKQVIGNIWGGSATTYAGTQPSPSAGNAYRNTVADSTTDYTAGLKFLSKSPSEVMNQALFNFSSALNDLQVHGTLQWENSTAYPVGAICFASDNLTYICIAASTGNDPTGGLNPSYWSIIPPQAMTSFQVNDSANVFGLILKWGKTPVLSSGAVHPTVTFKVGSTASPFPSACLNVQVTQDWSFNSSWAHACAVSNVTVNGFQVEFTDGISSLGQNAGNGAFGYYMAIGY